MGHSLTWGAWILNANIETDLIMLINWHELILITFGIGLSALGWFARQLWQAVQDMKEDHYMLKVEIPTKYVNKADHQLHVQRIETMQNEYFDKIDHKLDRIFDKLDAKVDK